MSTRNITLSLPTDLVRRAKVYAAEHDTTINALVRKLLQENLSRESLAREAAERLLVLADLGPYFATDPGAIRREDLHERR